MVEPTLIRTVFDNSGTAVLEIIKEEDTVTIFEADDMDRQVEFPSALIPVLIQSMENQLSSYELAGYR
jgi:hypothetical protein